MPTSIATATTILIVDDHPIVRSGYHSLIEDQEDIEISGEAVGLSDAMNSFHERPADLVVSDISLKDGSGLELTRELFAMDPDVNILISSDYDDALYAERALRAGAKGYVNKHESTDCILEAIRRVKDGQLYLCDIMAERMLCRSVGQTHEISPTPVDSLSDRELEVFEQIGRGQTTRAIAEKFYLSPKTIESYRENIKSKLDLQNATEMTQRAVRWVMELN